VWEIIFERYKLRWAPLWVGIAWTLVATVVYLSLAHIEADVPGGHTDKYAHVAAYAALMFWFTQIYVSVYSRVIIGCALALLGIGLEYLQAYTDYRTFERADMVANIAGIALGWLLGPPRTPNVLLHVEGRI
jgi:VanZ family protein